MDSSYVLPSFGNNRAGINENDRNMFFFLYTNREGNAPAKVKICLKISSLFLNRLWWMIACLTALALCGTLITRIYTRWDQNPVIVSFAERSTPVWEIPFPAVTICPETKAKTTRLNFTKMYRAMKDGIMAFNITEQE